VSHARAKPETASDLALSGTLSQAVRRPPEFNEWGVLRIRSSDLRTKLKERRTGFSILFIVDASSSMRGRGRMAQAKGLLRAYFKESYLRRDRVGLLVFRHNRSKVVLPLTSNVRRAEQALEELEVGGKTPLAEGMALGFRTLQQERYRNPDQETVLVVVSDGKPNLSLYGEDPLEEALSVARYIGRNRAALVFVDTEDDPLAFGYGPQVARAGEGIYRTMAALLKGRD
jgi:magnesium chelatase subunit D